ncbi:hypothetical protein [Salidesulfovibrio onnuriiensis]|uniref:hypothetical protein n=1 Tax=Salidesulfovibrio onnuriiensis TaxID=2583823 RepID=UPI0011C81F9D|nr:hypothetical protein [Salidesulfovibrio onnuriiensis]
MKKIFILVLLVFLLGCYTQQKKHTLSKEDVEFALRQTVDHYLGAGKYIFLDCNNINEKTYGSTDKFVILFYNNSEIRSKALAIVFKGLSDELKDVSFFLYKISDDDRTPKSFIYSDEYNFLRMDNYPLLVMVKRNSYNDYSKDIFTSASSSIDGIVRMENEIRSFAEKYFQ